MKYFLQTDIDLLTPSIEQQINQLLTIDHDKLILNGEYLEKSDSKINNRYLESIESSEEQVIFDQYRQKILDYYAGQKPIELRVYQLPDDLDREIFNRLPESIRNMPKPPYVRMQVMTNGDYLAPHSDVNRDVTLICPVTTADESTCWWAVREPHKLPAKSIPDIDKVECVAIARPAKGETWLYNINEIHSVERPAGRRDDYRVTIQFRWTNTSMLDVARALWLN